MHESVSPLNIYIVGSQCTGKTTLVNNLREYFTANPEAHAGKPPPVTITEVARSVLKEHSFTAADVVQPARCLELQRLILNAQAAAERRVSDRKDGWFISDRSGADPIAYALRYVGPELAQETLVRSAEWNELRERMKKSVVVVCKADAQAERWLHDDGVRLMPKDVGDWAAFHDLFCAFLREQGIPYYELSAGTAGHQERVEWVLSKMALHAVDFPNISGK
ncbi:AAA domain-containing protein [Cladorrhinum samala]|uniref:AAA domain-containing protein n=1 Tax=Cladorrhinum samala TaxID=585594 RepID=A0AAV9HAF8_9PEZI|nr:AAA domain-containing protein [Cladorrhinum samala]